MSDRLSSRFGSSSSRGHVRRRRRSLPDWVVVLAAVIGLLVAGAIIREIILQLGGENETTNAQHNRVWLKEAWTLNEVTPEQVDVLVERLQENNIDRIYVETGAWRVNGEYREHAYAQSFRERIRAADSDIEVLVWVWFEPEQHGDSTSQVSLVNYIRNATEEWGYDGVHLQGFNVFNGSEIFVRMVRALEEVLDGGVLSITVPPDHIPSDARVPRGAGNPSVSWQPEYKQRLIVIVDEIAVMAHAGGLESPEDYERWVSYQVETYARDIERIDVGTDMVVVLPSYPAAILHDPDIENVSTAINGARNGIRQAGDAGDRVIGAGLYFYENATPEDWAEFKDRWVD